MDIESRGRQIHHQIVDQSITLKSGTCAHMKLHIADLIDVDVVIVQHPEKRLQLLYVVAVPLEQILVLLYLVGVVARLLLLTRPQSLDLRLELVDLHERNNISSHSKQIVVGMKVMSPLSEERFGPLAPTTVRSGDYSD